MLHQKPGAQTRKARVREREREKMKGVERQWQNFWSRKRCEEAGMTGEAERGKVKEPGMEMS